MSEDTTRKFSASFEERVLSELAAINARLGSMENRMDSLETRLDSLETRLDSLETRMGSMETRLTSLEDKVDARLRETRPMWEAAQAQMKDIVRKLDTLDRKFDALIKDLFNLRVRVERLEDSQPTG